MKQTDMIIIRHYRSSAPRYDCCIVQESDAGHLLFLSLKEHKILEELRQEPTTLDQFLASSLSGERKLSLREAMLFIKRLYDAEFLLAPSDRIRDFAQKAIALEQEKIESPLLNWQIRAAQNLNPEVMTLRLHSVNAILAHYVETLHRPFFLLSLIVSATMLLAWQSESLWLERHDQFLSPVMFLLLFFLGLVVWNGLTTVATALFMRVRDRRGVSLKLQLIGRILPFFSVDDRSVMLWDARDQLRLRLFPLSLNLFIGTAGLSLVRLFKLDGLFALFLANYVWFAIQLNPLFDSSFNRLASGILGIENFLARMRSYFAHDLLRGIIESKAKGEEKTDEVVATWLVSAATLSFVWLYAVWVIASDFLLSFAPIYVDDWIQFAAAEAGLQQFRAAANLMASSLLGVIFAFLTLYPLVRLVAALTQNIWSASKLPMFKARRSLLDFQSSSLNANEALLNFLRTIPVFVHLSEPTLLRLSKALRAKPYAKKSIIIQQGEQGHIFYIVAVGEALVIKDNADGRKEIVSTLAPGDSFGEIALLENVVRTASVQAKSSAVMLMLSRKNFNAAFPEGSDERTLLTRTIRSMKLISDAQAFSHFSPQEARQLLKAATFVRIKAGETFIRQGDVADVAYLIERGTARVERQNKTGTGPVAILGRGELVGTIALVRETTRTASVVAETDILALQIPKGIFLDLCLTNPVVGIIIQELIQQQLAELEAG